MQCRAEGCSKSVDHRKRPDLLANCVDHQRAALIAAYRLALPTGRRALGMRHIHAYTTHLMIARVQQKDLVLLLDDLHPKLDRQGERRRLRPALVMRIWEGSAAGFQVGFLLHDLCGRWLQNRICVIAGCAKDRGPVWPSQLADNRAGSRCRRFEQEDGAPPDAGQIGDRSRRRLGLRRHRYANARHQRRDQNKETAAPAHVPPPFALFP
jgi:hypothetical protein